MRLYNIYYLCKAYIIPIRATKITQNSNGTIYYIENWKACENALYEIIKVPVLEQKAESVLNTMSAFEKGKTRPSIDGNTRNNFHRTLNELHDSMQTIIELYQSLGISSSGYGIDVKIPKCESLDEYMNYLKEINFIFTQCPYLSSKDEEIKFKSVDVGSQWLTFILISSGTFHILNNLAKILDKVITLKSHMASYKMQEEILHTMELKNEIASEVVDTFQTMKRLTINKYVKELESEIGELNDGEEEGKVEKSLEKLVDLADKGVEIRASIETPNEIKTLFPLSEDNLTLPDNLVKMLEDKSGDKKE